MRLVIAGLGQDSYLEQSDWSNVIDSVVGRMVNGTLFDGEVIMKYIFRRCRWRQ